jgi:hypothetical protein
MSTYAEMDRVRRQTEPEELSRIDEQIARNVRFYATQPDSQIAARIRELDEEWSMERYLDTNAAGLAFTGTFLGLAVNKKWFGLTAVVSGFLLLHAVTGWCPPVPALRKMGVRTRSEIDREKFALKALRGDFKGVPLPDRNGNEMTSDALLKASTT